MEQNKLRHASPAEKEAARIAEIRSLSYAQRLERLLALIELSHAIKQAPRLQTGNDERTDY